MRWLAVLSTAVLVSLPRSAAVSSFAVSNLAGNGIAAYAGFEKAPSLVANVSFNTPAGLAFDDGTILAPGQGAANYYVIADFGNAVVRVVNVSGSSVRVLAGIAGSTGSAGTPGPATSAQLAGPMSVALGAGSVFVGDSNSRVLQVGG